MVGVFKSNQIQEMIRYFVPDGGKKYKTYNVVSGKLIDSTTKKEAKDYNASKHQDDSIPVRLQVLKKQF